MFVTFVVALVAAVAVCLLDCFWIARAPAGTRMKRHRSRNTGESVVRVFVGGCVRALVKCDAKVIVKVAPPPHPKLLSPNGWLYGGGSR